MRALLILAAALPPLYLLMLIVCLSWPVDRPAPIVVLD